MEDVIFNVFNNNNFIDLTIYQYGYEKCKPSHSFGPTFRQHYLFHYIISGKGKAFLQKSKNDTFEKPYNLSKGQGFLISPNFSSYYIADDKQPWEYIWIEFGGLKATEYLKLSGLSYKSPIYDCNPQHSNKIKDKLFDIINSDKNDPLESIGNLYLFLYLLKSNSKNKMKSINGDLKKFYVKESINYIENNYQNDISIEDIASFCGLNKSYFGKIFKDIIKNTPQDFLITYRMIKACELLKTSTLSIKEVGEKVGYPNQLHFSKIFKNTYGISPREWKLKNQYKI